MTSTTDETATHIPGLPSREEVVALCYQKGSKFNSLVYPSPEHPIAYIKYWAVTMGEARTQQYIREHTKDQSGAHIPEIYDFFESNRRCYIVMEYVSGQTVTERLQTHPEDLAWITDAAAKAIIQLMSVPPPIDATPGPVGGGHVRHYFFRNHVAPKTYASIEELEHHINKVLSVTPTPKRVDFSSDHLMFYYSDIHAGNFMLTKDNQLYVIDFADAGYLPESFMSHALRKPVNHFARDIAAKVAFRKSENQAAMIYASYLFHIISEDWPGHFE